jgi:predicted RNA-binding Zn-ribbon protein involved in translation (DUF1610 family)
MDVSKVLADVVKYHKLDCTSFDKFLSEVHKLANKHYSLLAQLESAFNQAVINSNKVLVTCPNCGTKTLISFTDCHLCGHNLIEVVEEQPVALKNVVKEVETKKAITKPEVQKPADDIDFSDETSNVEEVVEQPRKRGRPPVNKENTPVVKETPKPSKPAVKEVVEPKKVTPSSTVNLDEDDDFSFDDEDNITPATPLKNETGLELEDDDNLFDDSVFDDADFDDIELD